jgi:hypothetical protein
LSNDRRTGECQLLGNDITLIKWQLEEKIKDKITEEEGQGEEGEFSMAEEQELFVS